MVNQDPVLFSTSIRDNIAYGLSDCSLEQIEEAARSANAHDFISQLKNGYDTGERMPKCSAPESPPFLPGSGAAAS